MEQNPSKSKFEDFIRSQGFYVALALCLLVVGAAIVISVLPGQENIQEQNAQQSAPDTIENGSQGQEASLSSPTQMPVIHILPSVTAAPEQEEEPETVTEPVMATATEAPTTQQVSSTTKAPAPVQGKVIWEFAMDRLLYSKTLDQWTTHEGVDIGCEEGTKVKAVLAGTVEEVREDDALGYTVVISHPGDKKSLYANLSSEVPVKAGDKVNAGDTVGLVGHSSLLECGDESHLHFGFYVKGVAVEPGKYVRLGS